MTNAKLGKGERLGPFRLGRRHRSGDPEMADPGRLYEAHMMERMEWNGATRSHLMRQPESRLERWTAGARRMLGLGVEYWIELSILGLVLILVAAHCRVYIENQRGEQIKAAVQEHRAPAMVDTGDNMEPGVIAYPLPDRPFIDQAKAPCNPRKSEVELNGGCWLELAKRPPCGEDYAEYQGKCYVPVAARSRKPREPQAIQP